MKPMAKDIPVARTCKPRRAASGCRAREAACRSVAQAFTLLEILIAVAALGLIAVGVAAIFDATGKTITAGRRVSAFNSYASLIEQQLRSDIAAMTREGFLVIRTEYASAQGNATVNVLPQLGNPDAVPLYDGDERARLRRVDELMFFAKGEFVSARAALHPSYLAKSDAARVYYGHGQRARVPAAFNANSPYYKPELNGANAFNGGTPDDDARLGYFNQNTNPPNPNRFASDWILVRHVALLAPPRTSELLATGPILGIPANSPRFYDSSVQVSLQPAASNLFRSLYSLFPVAVPLPQLLRNEAEAMHPAMHSGLVDIAATDLAVIRQVVMTARVAPNTVTGRFFIPGDNADPQEVNNMGPDGVFRIWGNNAPQDPAVIGFMQAWMDDAFPANSMAQATQRERMRCELSPRNFVGIGEAAQANAWPDEEAAYRRADQIMLSASNFLPRCTEFIVEWSFGRTYPSDPSTPGYAIGQDGQIIWHGLERWVGGAQVAKYYNINSGNPFEPHRVPYSLVSGSPRTHTVQTRLIHGENVAITVPQAGEPLSSYFGYFDPTFNPDGDNDGKLESQSDSSTPTIPWAWPTLIRVTLSLADPSDPSIERTFQFVFKVPDGV